MTHRGPFQPLPFCDSGILRRRSPRAQGRQRLLPPRSPCGHSANGSLGGPRCSVSDQLGEGQAAGTYADVTDEEKAGVRTNKPKGILELN